MSRSRGPTRAPLLVTVPGWVALALLAVSTLYPVVFVVFSALRTAEAYSASAAGLPTEPTLANLDRAWQRSDFPRLAMNSFFVVSTSCALIAVVSCLAGFALTHLRFPLRRAIMASTVLLMIMPASVLMISIFKVVKQVGLLNDRLGLSLVYTALFAPFSTFMMVSYLRSVPQELMEAAEIDGASPLRRFTAVALPLVRPGLLTLLTLNFLLLWNEFLFSLLLLNDGEKRTMMVGVALLQGQFDTPVPLLSAGMVFSMLPPLAVFALFQRRLAEGITAGALK